MAEKSAGVRQMHLPDFQLVSLGVENNFAEQSTQLLMKPSGPKKEKSRRLSFSDHGKGIAGFVRNEKEKNYTNPCAKEKSSIGAFLLSNFYGCSCIKFSSGMSGIFSTKCSVFERLKGDLICSGH
jgi:hypothetical protein